MQKRLFQNENQKLFLTKRKTKKIFLTADCISDRVRLHRVLDDGSTGGLPSLRHVSHGLCANFTRGAVLGTFDWRGHFSSGEKQILHSSLRKKFVYFSPLLFSTDRHLPRPYHRYSPTPLLRILRSLQHHSQVSAMVFLRFLYSVSSSRRRFGFMFFSPLSCSSHFMLFAVPFQVFL